MKRTYFISKSNREELEKEALVVIQVNHVG